MNAHASRENVSWDGYSKRRFTEGNKANLERELCKAKYKNNRRKPPELSGLIPPSAFQPHHCNQKWHVPNVRSIKPIPYRIQCMRAHGRVKFCALLSGMCV